MTSSSFLLPDCPLRMLTQPAHRRPVRATQCRTGLVPLPAHCPAHGDVAQEAAVAGAAQRHSLGLARPLVLAPGEQLSQLCRVQSMPGLEVRVGAEFGRSGSRGRPAGSRASRRCGCPSAAEFLGNRATVLDGQIGNAAPCVELVRRDDRLRRADVDAALQLPHRLAGAATSALRADRCRSRQEKTRSRLRASATACSCRSSRGRRCAPALFPVRAHCRRRRGSRAVDLHGDALGQLLQPRAHQLVIVAAQGVA